METSFEIIKPDDWHLHLRSELILKKVLPFTSRHFSRALVMPNLPSPIVSFGDAFRYKKEVISAIPSSHKFEPLMTLFLNKTTSVDDIKIAFEDNLITAVKYYPAGATTLSDHGVQNLDSVMPILEKMSELGVPLCLHGEVTDAEIDIFDREKVFIETTATLLAERLPDLKITFEHITTCEAVEFIKAMNENFCASITTHHLVINRSDIFRNGIRPHYFCLPIAKREHHRKALLEVATSGHKKSHKGLCLVTNTP